MQLTRVKQCPQCGSRHVIYVGKWEDLKYDNDIPRANFADNDLVYWCEGNECNELFALREEHKIMFADRFSWWK